MLPLAVSRSAAPEIVAAQSGADRVSAGGDNDTGGWSTDVTTENCKRLGGRQLPRLCVLGTGRICERTTFVVCSAPARG